MELGGIGGLLPPAESLINTALYYGVDRPRNEMREDTAVRRRMADLRAAGINPILAAGQDAASQPGGGPGLQGAPTMGEMIQLQAARAEREKTKAETQLIQAQKEKELAETNSIQQATTFGADLHPYRLLGDKERLRHETAYNPLLELSQTERNRFEAQVNPERFLLEQRQATAAQKQNRILDLEEKFRELHIDIEAYEKEMKGVQRDIMNRFGMSTAEADAFLKEIVVQMDLWGLVMKGHDSRLALKAGSPSGSPEGSGIIGQVRQLVNALLNPESDKKPIMPFRDWRNQGW